MGGNAADGIVRRGDNDYRGVGHGSAPLSVAAMTGSPNSAFAGLTHQETGAVADRLPCDSQARTHPPTAHNRDSLCAHARKMHTTRPPDRGPGCVTPAKVRSASAGLPLGVHRQASAVEPVCWPAEQRDGPLHLRVIG